MSREAVQALADAEWLCAATAWLVLQQCGAGLQQQQILRV